MMEETSTTSTDPDTPQGDVAAMAERPARRIRARATVSMAGMPRGRVATVDPSDPYIAGLLARGRLVPVEEERRADAE